MEEATTQTAPEQTTDWVYDFIVQYLTPVILVLGAVGNCLSILVFSRKRNQNKASCTYLIFLSLIDLVNLSLGMQMNLFASGALNDMATSSLGCKIRMYVYWVCTHLSSWILIVFTIERCLVIVFPLKMKTAFDSGKGRRIALSSLFLSTAALYVYYPFDTEKITSNGRGNCFLMRRMTHVEAFLSDFVQIGLCYLVPMFLIPIGNIIILVSIKSLNDDEKSRKQNLVMLRNLVILTCAQFVANGPYTVVLVMKAFEGGSWSDEDLKNLYITSLVVRLSYCINPFLYIFSLDYYRSELKRILLPCLKGATITGSEQTSVTAVTK